MTQMTVSGHQRTYVTVALDDEQNSSQSAQDLISRLRALFKDGLTTVLVDISRAHRLSSDTVAALLGARREAAARGGRVVLHAPNRRSAALVSRSVLGGLFEVDDTATPSLWRHP
jgi:anti-anti-sigma regulatory factor